MPPGPAVAMRETRARRSIAVAFRDIRTLPRRRGVRALPTPDARRARGGLSMQGARTSACLRHHAPEGDQRPDTLEEHEAPLAPVPGIHGQDGRADEIREEIRIRILREHPELREHEANEDQNRADDLDDLLGHAAR